MPTPSQLNTTRIKQELSDIEQSNRESIQKSTEQREARKKQEGKDALVAIIISLIIVGPFIIYLIKNLFEETSVVELLEIIPAAIILIPILFIIGGVLHSSFYTGVIYKRDKFNKPKRTWV